MGQLVIGLGIVGVGLALAAFPDKAHKAAPYWHGGSVEGAKAVGIMFACFGGMWTLVALLRLLVW